MESWQLDARQGPGGTPVKKCIRRQTTALNKVFQSVTRTASDLICGCDANPGTLWGEHRAILGGTSVLICNFLKDWNHLKF